MTGPRTGLGLALLIPVLFAAALLGLLARAGGEATVPRGRPPLLTPVVLDGLIPPPREASSAAPSAPAHGDGLKAW